MKRFISLVLLLIFLLTFVGCASKPDGAVDTPESDETANIPALSEIINYTQEQLEEKLIGLSINELCDSWGKPDYDLSGPYGVVWYLNEEHTQHIVVYYTAHSQYEESGIITDIAVSEWYK